MCFEPLKASTGRRRPSMGPDAHLARGYCGALAEGGSLAIPTEHMERAPKTARALDLSTVEVHFSHTRAPRCAAERAMPRQHKPYT
jgi:hypothetical protein